MSFKKVGFLCMAFAVAARVNVSVAQDAGGAGVGIEELKDEMKGPAVTNVQVAEPKVDVAAPAAPAPVIEELAPEPAKVEEKPAAPAPEAAAPAPAPKAEASAEAPAAPQIEELAPAAPKAEAPVAEPAPVPAQAPVAAPAEVEKPAEVAAPAEIPAAKPAEKAPAQLGSEQQVKMATLVAQQEEVRRQARELEGRKAFETAESAWKQGDYPAALSQYQAALGRLPVAPHTMLMRKTATERMPEGQYRVALALIKDGKEAEALAKGEEYLKLNPNNKPLEKLVAKLKGRVPVVQPPKTGEKPDDLGPADETETARQMRLAKQYMVRRDFGKAREGFESVLAMEPGNREAMSYLKELGDREYNYNSAERKATVARMNAEVRDTWNPKYAVIKGQEPKPAQTNAPGESVIEAKMKKIIIDEIEFRQSNMHDVVKFFNERSRDCDKTETDDSRKGVNFVLNLNPTGAAAPAPKPAAEGGDLFGGEQAGPAGGAPGIPEVTFSARYMSLFSALKTVTKIAGLKYLIEDEIVMIIPADWDPSTIEVRMYPVEPTFIERVKQASAEMPAQREIGGRQVEQLGGGGVGGEVADLKSYFEGMGVPFPKGSSIQYNPISGKVVVGNTAQNLIVFERLLAELNVVPKQVQIEARFVEVNETDLFEAGLEWLLTDNYEALVKNSGGIVPLGGAQRVQVNKNSTEGGFTKGLRFMGTDSSSELSAQGGGRGTLGAVASISSVLTNPELTMVLHALQQNGNADLLSAPKVTAQNGAEATIKVVTEYIYPTSFDVNGGQLQSGGTATGNNIVQETTVVPQDFATREVGVILNVLPEVSPDGNMINLTMKPQVVTDPTWYQYGSTVRRADGSEMTMNMPQPFFHVRSIDTKISIYDGATVVMGGLITEDLKKVNDKIPILGDIPLLGALFRSRSEHSIKRNLLIFVTAKLVDPSGTPIRKTDEDAAKAKTAAAAAAPAAK